MHDSHPRSLEGAPEPYTEVSSWPGQLRGHTASHLWKRGCSPITVREGKPAHPRTPLIFLGVEGSAPHSQGWAGHASWGVPDKRRRRSLQTQEGSVACSKHQRGPGGAAPATQGGPAGPGRGSRQFLPLGCRPGKATASFVDE